MEFRGFPLGALVPVRSCLSPTVSAAHLPLRFRQLGRAPLPVAEVGQVVDRVCRRSRGAHAPVDADGAFNLGRCPNIAADYKRCEPVPKAVLIHTDTARVRRQIAGPHHRDTHPRRQAQATVTDREPAGCVVQRREGSLAGLKFRPTPSFDLERVIQRLRVGPQHLLLSDLGSLTQPSEPVRRLGEQLRQATQSWAPP